MPEIKRTVENPPVGLQKAVISRSESKQWATAKREWRMKNYYYATNKCCPCSPRTVANITVIVNTITFEELEICNSCAERYFGITLSSSIENSLRRIKKNILLGVNTQSLDYLLKNHVINTGIYKCYQTAIRQRKQWESIEIREQINTRMIIFTTYENKEAFDIIDILLAYAASSKEDVDNIIKFWTDIILEFKPVNIKVLKDTLSNLDRNNYNIDDIEKGRNLLDDFVNKDWYRRHPRYEAKSDENPYRDWPISQAEFPANTIKTKIEYFICDGLEDASEEHCNRYFDDDEEDE